MALWQRTPDIEALNATLKDSTGAVSYTHLDVYKRQVIDCCVVVKVTAQ